jgi:hypothetical protein
VSVGLLTLSLAIAPLAVGLDVEVESVVRTETRAGVVPTSNDPNLIREVADFELVPSAEVSLLSSDQALALRYRPRVFFRLPNDAGRALLLHQIEGLWRWRIAPETRLSVSGYVSRGDVSYGRLLDAQAAATAAQSSTTLPEDLIVETFSMIGLGTLVHRFDAVQRLTIDFRAQLTEARSNVNVVPDQYILWVAPAFTQTLSRQDDLELALTVGDVGFVNRAGMQTTMATMSPVLVLPNRSDFPTIEPRIGWRRVFTPRLNATVRVGYAMLLSDFPQSTPIADATLQGTIYGEQNRVLTGQLSLGVQAYANPIFQAFGPRAFATGALDFRWRPHLSARMSASIYTPLRTDSGRLDSAGNPIPFTQQTIYTVRIPIIWTFTDELELEAGLRLSEHAPNLHDPTGYFSFLELLGYAAFTVTLGRGAEMAGVAAGR